MSLLLLLLLYCTARWDYYNNINQLNMRTNTSEKEKCLLPDNHRNFDRQFFPAHVKRPPTHCWIMLIKIGPPLFPINYHICIIWVKRIKQFNTSCSTVYIYICIIIFSRSVRAYVCVCGGGRGRQGYSIIIYIYTHIGTVSGRVTVYGLFS